ncbi:MAG: diguanylate cyclase [Synergistaceae bacterium]|nr:diguanylate cyclase [Synergistaceae bacterium]
MEKILIVDDSMLSLRILSDILKEEYDVMASKEGREALKMAKEYSPTIILLDIVMPVMDGFEVLAELKQMPETSNIPVIFITSLNDPENEEKGLILGATDYIYKPFSPRVVKARVKNHIDLFLMRKTIEDLALIDALSKIHNRRSFDLRSEVEWARAMREQTCISTAILDIDDFKKYNDHYGHLEGDGVIKSVANRISSSLSRKTDFVARYGGEEFVVLLPATPSENGEKLLQKICENIKDLAIPHAESPTTSVVTVSIGGTSTIPQMGEGIKDFIEIADQMLYKAKKEGKNRVVWNAYPALK